MHDDIISGLLNVIYSVLIVNRQITSDCDQLCARPSKFFNTTEVDFRSCAWSTSGITFFSISWLWSALWI